MWYRINQLFSALARCRRPGVFALVLLTSVLCQAEDNNSWVEEKINPSTEWLEETVNPVTRWMERRIHTPVQPQPVLDDVPVPGQIPAELIAPQEAARLLLLLFPGDVLQIRLLATQPNAYSIKLLSDSGTISTFYMDARDGTLLEQLPPLEAMPEDSSDENSDR